jgi:hypothetical protein
MHSTEWSEHLKQNDPIRIAFEAGVHLGIAIGEKEAQRDNANL